MSTFGAVLPQSLGLVPSLWIRHVAFIAADHQNAFTGTTPRYVSTACIVSMNFTTSEVLVMYAVLIVHDRSDAPVVPGDDLAQGCVERASTLELVPVHEL